MRWNRNEDNLGSILCHVYCAAFDLYSDAESLGGNLIEDANDWKNSNKAVVECFTVALWPKEDIQTAMIWHLDADKV